MFTRIEEADLLNKGNVGLPDTPNLTTAEMQAKMDELSRDVIIPKLNNLIDELESHAAASDLGIEPPEQFVSTTIQSLIAEIALVVLENQLKAHGHENKDVLDIVTLENTEAWNKLVEVLGHITSVSDTIADSTTDIPNSHAIVEYVKALGAGDMQKAVYDSNNSGIVDNAEHLGGEAPDAFQRVFDELLNTMAKTIPGAINEVLSELGDVNALSTSEKSSVVDAVNEVHCAIPEMLENLEEVEANNEPGKAVDALTVKEISNKLDEYTSGLSEVIPANSLAEYLAWCIENGYLPSDIAMTDITSLLVAYEAPYTSSYNISKIFDGKISTETFGFWAYNVSPAKADIILTFAQAVSIAKIHWTNEESDKNGRISKMTVAYSDDKSAWTTFGSYNLTSPTENDVEINASSKHQYWKLSVENSWSDSYVGGQECVIYGSR